MTASMRTYRAAKFGVVYAIEDRNARQINPRLDLLSLSPGGFAWGHFGTGKGDRQLALAILADVYDDERALRLYERFAERAIYPKAKDGPFVMPLAEVLTAVEAIEKETV
ncbi:MAG: hypothetical protein A3E78_03235 [Alphaproteobacteria bacterium RIFCSPHIGHO2_12_FULL_63_12]|nr:MAG: hypothetical protein A3E78_03235 [Alphaproteobacteria bacterium RIFCSPHIGHO2_12_FULL_63_12]